MEVAVWKAVFVHLHIHKRVLVDHHGEPVEFTGEQVEIDLVQDIGGVQLRMDSLGINQGFDYTLSQLDEFLRLEELFDVDFLGVASVVEVHHPQDLPGEFVSVQEKAGFVEGKDDLLVVDAVQRVDPVLFEPVVFEGNDLMRDVFDHFEQTPQVRVFLLGGFMDLDPALVGIIIADAYLLRVALLHLLLDKNDPAFLADEGENSLENQEVDVVEETIEKVVAEALQVLEQEHVVDLVQVEQVEVNGQEFLDVQEAYLPPREFMAFVNIQNHQEINESLLVEVVPSLETDDLFLGLVSDLLHRL